MRLYRACEKQDVATAKRWTAYLLACRETRELRDEERNRGAAFTRLIKLGTRLPARMVAAVDAEPALRYGVARRALGISARELALSLGYSWIESAVMAGVKLVPFGQQAAQQLIIDLSDHFAAGFEQAFLRGDDALGAATPLSAIASARHETQYSRLFRS
ncbi:urease accessory protein UreF [Enterobacter hormaechei]